MDRRLVVGAFSLLALYTFAGWAIDYSLTYSAEQHMMVPIYLALPMFLTGLTMTVYACLRTENQIEAVATSRLFRWRREEAAALSQQVAAYGEVTVHGISGKLTFHPKRAGSGSGRGR